MILYLPTRIRVEILPGGSGDAIIPLGVAGDIAIIYGTVVPGTVHVIDVNGYFE